MGLIYPYQGMILAKIEIKKYLRGSLLLYRGVTIFQLYAKKDKKGKYCALFAVLEEEKGILYISIRPYLAGPQGENYIYYLENGSTVGEKCPGAKHNH